MSDRRRQRAAVAALAAILAITASWWALALWRVEPGGPEWVLRTREACFGSNPDGLPNAGGWVLLVGQPLGMLILLVAAWGPELRAGLGRVTSRIVGQLTVGAVLALIVAGASGVVVRVRTAGLEPFSVGQADLARQLTRVNDPAPALALTDQSGREITLASFRGRRVIVAFAYAHCQTVCPLIVADVLAVQDRVSDNPPAVLVVTLDPWRDTPSRLASIAKQWGITTEAHVLSGAPDTVERTLNAWRVPRARNEKTGEITHPSMAYVIGADGRIAYVVTGNAEAISAAVRAL
jgi:cytochrome oxidase Cu insertion factor (SCO1/SenC/PrrC family)